VGKPAWTGRGADHRVSAKRIGPGRVKLCMNSTPSLPGNLQLLGESVDICGNARRAWEYHRSLFWLLLATAGLDALSTIAFMSVLGVDKELNPVVRQFAHWLGIVAGPVFGKVPQMLAAGALVILTPRLARFILAVVALMNLSAFVLNLRVYVAA
jgi:hypothetical protein